MRVACPPLLYPCEFLNFSRSKKALELATRKAIKLLEGEKEVDPREYENPDSDKYQAMTESIRKTLNLTSLQFQRIEDLVEAIGLPREKVCLHCWDNSSIF